MKKIITLLFICLSISNLQAQYKEVRKAAAHHGVSTATSLNVVYIESDRNEIVLESEKKEHLDKILSEVKNGILYIQYKSNTKITTKKANKVTIYSNSKLQSLKASSSSRLHIEAPIHASSVAINSSSSANISVRHLSATSLNIDINSSGSLDAHVKTSKAFINASSSSKVLLAGQINEANVKMSSSAKIDLAKAKVNDVICDGSSSASLNIENLSTLRSDLSSSASISYSKIDQILQNKNSSSGRLIKKS